MVGLLLLNWVLLTVGIPIPLPIAKDRSQPYPCMDGQCGCGSAAACWKSCCCHTDLEKVLWANRRGITPPAFVLEAAKREAAKITAQKCELSSTKSCCQKSHSNSCTKESISEDQLATLTQALAQDEADKKPSKKSSKEDTGSDTLTLSSWLRCQGQGVTALADLEGVLPTGSNPLPSGALVSAWLTNSDQHPLEVAYLPPVPPPQKVL